MGFGILQVSAISIGVPAIAGTLVVRRLPVTMKILYAFVILTGIFELLTIVARLPDGSNLYLFHSYVYIEFGVITAIYYRLFDNRLWKGIALSFFAIFLVFSVINVGFYEGIKVFNSNQRYVEGLMVITLCISYFAQLMRRAEEPRLTLSPYFWLNSGWLIYFSGTLFLFLVSRELMANDMRSFFEIHGVLNIGLNLIYMLALILGRNK